MIIIASYTANMAAIFTADASSTPFSSIEQMIAGNDKLCSKAGTVLCCMYMLCCTYILCCM
jgi:hypothetical protein